MTAHRGSTATRVFLASYHEWYMTSFNLRPVSGSRSRQACKIRTVLCTYVQTLARLLSYREIWKETLVALHELAGVG